MSLKIKLIKNAPTLLTITGVILSGLSIFSAIKSTQKIERETVDLKKKIVKDYNGLMALDKSSPDYEEEYKVIQEVYKQDKKTLNKKYMKAYVPCTIIFALSTAAIVSSHNIFKARNIALAGTLSTLKASLDAYRGRVKDAVGEAKEKALFNNLDVKEVTTEDGKQVTYSKKEGSEHTEKVNIYEAFYGPGNVGFERAHGNLNVKQLEQAEQYFNQKLVCKGYVFLSDVYEQLGFTADMLGPDKLQAAHIVGWIYDNDNPNADNYISFGIHDKYGNLTTEAKRLMAGLEDGIWLEFNAQGDILTGIHKRPTFMKKAIEKGA